MYISVYLQSRVMFIVRILYLFNDTARIKIQAFTTSQTSFSRVECPQP